MSAFTLDTSGTIETGHKANLPGFHGVTLWRDLDAFTQGYVEALFTSVDGFARIDLDRPGQWAFKGFSDLAPETLARIIADCEAFRAAYPQWEHREQGGQFWSQRQTPAAFHGFPLLTVQLGDDGKVVFA